MTLKNRGDNMKWYWKLIFTILTFLAVFLFYYTNSYLWKGLEMVMDGEIHTSNADTIINMVITYLATKNMIKKNLTRIYT